LVRRAPTVLAAVLCGSAAGGGGGGGGGAVAICSVLQKALLAPLQELLAARARQKERQKLMAAAHAPAGISSSSGTAPAGQSFAASLFCVGPGMSAGGDDSSAVLGARKKASATVAAASGATVAGFPA
ncbi:unnamed protein product, partial [Phaeothamnion confervicola]